MELTREDELQGFYAASRRCDFITGARLSWPMLYGGPGSISENHYKLGAVISGNSAGSDP